MNAPRAAVAWVVGDDTGISSKMIFAKMLGAESAPSMPKHSHPRDPDDFGRCYRLLDRVPQWRARIGEMADISPTWRRLAEHWDELTALYEEEIGTGCDRFAHFGRGPRLYARMKALGA